MNQTTSTTGRVTAQFQHMYTVTTENETYTCSVSGKFRHEAESERDYPVIGDYVEFTVREHGQGLIRRLLERRTVLSRAAAGNETREQLICANVDFILITMACGHDFNLRRLERYSLAAWETGATPLIVLTKSDQVDSADALVDELTFDGSWGRRLSCQCSHWGRRGSVASRTAGRKHHRPRRLVRCREIDADERARRDDRRRDTGRPRER